MSTIKKTNIEEIENEFDLKVFEEYEKDKTDGTLVTRPIEELWKEIEV
jgi:hypothetical protein